MLDSLMSTTDDPGTLKSMTDQVRGDKPGRNAPMHLETRTELLADGTVVVAVAGELDLQTAPQFERQLLEATSNGASRAIIDLSQCGFLDSSALHLLLATKQRLGARAGKLALVIADDALLLPFRVTGLDRLFAIHPTREAALPAARPPRGRGRERGKRSQAHGSTSTTLVVNDHHVPLPRQDTERLLAELREYADGPSPLAGAARAFMTRMHNPSRIGFYLRAVDVQPGEDLVLLDVLSKLEPRNERLVRLERALRLVAAGAVHD
jgi:anti-sigma B factor antagonist